MNAFEKIRSKCGSEPAASLQMTPEVLFQLTADDQTHVLNASRAQGSLTHRDAHATGPTNVQLESVSGMNIDRH